MSAHVKFNWDKQSFGTAAILFGLLFVSFAWFANDIRNANALTRLFATIAILDDGSTKLDAYEALTIDKAKIGEHTYADKAPGMSLMALAPVGLARLMARAAGIDLNILRDGGLRRAPVAVLVGTAAIFTSGLLAAIAGTASFLLLRALIGSSRIALASTLITWLGTPLWGWSGRFFGHAAAAALLFIAFAAWIALARSTAAAMPQKALLTAGAAFAMSWAGVVEFTAFPAALVLVIYALYSVRFWPPTEIVQLALIGIAASVAALLPLFVYNLVSFGSMFKVGYQNVVGFPGMKSGFLGLAMPKPLIALKLLIGPHRGLVWFAPILLIVPFGLWRMRREARALAIVVIVIGLYYLLLNSSYYYWGGGWSTGPRHMTPLLPFLALPLAFALRDARGPWRAVIYGICALSVAIALMCAAVSMAAPEYIAFALGDFIGAKFFTGAFTTPLSTLLHVNVFLSIVLYLVVAGGALVVLLRRVKSHAATAAPESEFGTAS